MTYTAQHRTGGRSSDTAVHVFTLVLTVVGILAAAVGAFIAYGADNGTLTLFSWTWNTADITDGLASSLMIGGGFAAAVTMAVASARDWAAENSTWLVALETALMLIGLAAVVAGIILLF